MSLRRKIFLAFFLIIALMASLAIYWSQREARDSYAYVIEEVLVDTSQLLASQIEGELKLKNSMSLSQLNWAQTFEKFKVKRYDLQIKNLSKQETDLDAYITDQDGRVIYSSRDTDEVGKDYSKWRDVYLTLRGQYGTRTTRTDINDKKTSSYYIAAPILIDDKIVGVVTVIKARANIVTILDMYFNKIFIGVILTVLAALLFGSLLFVWITQPIENLKKYALDIARGEKTSLPALPHKDIQQLGEAFEQMRISLEGKKTIERFIQSLIHELKSPLSAMKGSAELILEPMKDEQRHKFINNIINESSRSELILEKILNIAELESKNELSKIESINLIKSIENAENSFMANCQKNNLEFVNNFSSPDVFVEGDAFLLNQALRNIIQNAVDFSLDGGSIFINIEQIEDSVKIEIIDQGSGIPDFAMDKIFEKFYSLERPQTGKKGTGLGLSFVYEVISLHKGTIKIENIKNSMHTGVKAIITLPTYIS